ncbi:MAG: sulfotransferase [Flavobacteriaceae bacterium]|nr:sulfotransferase [Flavobacteriaceae bacterium]
MTKEFFFLAGLQRSGATIISQILNQNPDIWVSPASPLFTMMKSTFETHLTPEYIDYQRPQAMAEVLHEMAQAFYKEKPAKYIIDKNLNWPTPIGVEMIARYLSANIKIICPVRNILDILVSFDTIINAHPDSANNQIDKAVLEKTLGNKPMADRRADLLMQEDKDIYACLHNMKHALIPEYRKYFHFVDYDDFVADPKKEIEKIYAFLEIENYTHEFENVKDVSEISEDSLTGIKYLHTIRPAIQKISRRPEDVFLPETIEKYSGLEFWRGI